VHLRDRYLSLVLLLQTFGLRFSMVCARITRLSARTSRVIKPPCRPKGARRREGRTIVQRQRDSLCVRLTSHKTLTPTLLAIVDTSLSQVVSP